MLGQHLQAPGAEMLTHLVSAVFLEFLVEFQRNTDHHFRLVSIGV